MIYIYDNYEKSLKVNKNQLKIEKFPNYLI